MSKTFSVSDVASHKTASDLWIMIDGDVYDMTKFKDEHPGGAKILTRVAGKDASKQFWKYHNEGILKKYQPRLKIGSLDSKPQPKTPPTPPKTPELKQQAKQNEREVPRVLEPEAVPGAVAPQPGPAAKEHKEALEQFGDLVPYADPSWYQSVRPIPNLTQHRPVRGANINVFSVELALLQRDTRSTSKGSPGLG